jgi:L-fuconolactonase
MTYRIDAHHHLWDLAARPQPWMDAPGNEPMRRDFGVDDLLAAITGHNIAGTVAVQAVADVAETEELLDLAERVPAIAGVIGYVDVAAVDVGEQLDRLLARASGRWLVGIRSLVQYETDPHWLSRPAVRAGMSQVADRNLVHDLLLLPHQLADAASAIAATPGGRFVIDHLAKPSIASAALEPWASGLARVASCANVTAKLSGLVTEAAWTTWMNADLQPYVDHALATFGPQRLMFGSDWPVCTLAATYEQVVTSAEHLVSALSPDEQAAVFVGTATSVYSLSGRIAPHHSEHSEREST